MDLEIVNISKQDHTSASQIVQYQNLTICNVNNTKKPSNLLKVGIS
jgi:hypothetical protein